MIEKTELDFKLESLTREQLIDILSNVVRYACVPDCESNNYCHDCMLCWLRYLSNKRP